VSTNNQLVDGGRLTIRSSVLANLERVARMRLARKLVESRFTFVLWGQDALVYAFGAQEIPIRECHFLVPDDCLQVTASFLQSTLSYKIQEEHFGYLCDHHGVDSSRSRWFPRAVCLSKPPTDMSYLDKSVPFDPMSNSMFEPLQVVMHPASSFAFDISNKTRTQPLSSYTAEAGIRVPTLAALLDSIAAVIHEPPRGCYHLRLQTFFEIWLECLVYYAPGMRRDDGDAITGPMTPSQLDIMHSLAAVSVNSLSCFVTLAEKLQQNWPWFRRLVTNEMMPWNDAVRERRDIFLSMEYV
jgi:hypothetical protein